MIGYPALHISLYVRNRRIVVIGSSPGADERAARLAKLGASVVTIAPSEATLPKLEGAFAVFVVVPDRDRCRDLAKLAQKTGALVYAEDVPDASDLAMPAIAERGFLKLAISTDGCAPALSRHLKGEWQRLLDAAGFVLDRFLEELKQRRERTPVAERKVVLSKEAQRLRLEGQLTLSEPERDR
jgi:siroheme synthase (precorrin-2 oxidase/ferrochelatase)